MHLIEDNRVGIYSNTYMSCSVLEVLCGDIKKSRNLAYFGRYSEAKDEFGLIIQKI